MEVCSIYISKETEIETIFTKKNRFFKRGIKDFKRSFMPFFISFFAILSFFGCNSKDKNHRRDERDSVIYSKQNYSELSLDSTKLLTFFAKNPSSDSIQNQVAQFYSWRGFQYAWLSKNGLSLAAINFYEQLNADSEIFSDKSLISRQLDSLFVEANTDEKVFLTQTQNVEKL